MKKEETVPYNARLPKSLKNTFAKKAKAEKRSMNNLLILVIEDYLRQAQTGVKV